MIKHIKTISKKNIEHPKFKSKKTSKQIFPTASRTIQFNGKTVFISKIGSVKYKTDLPVEDVAKGNFYNPRVFKKNNKYFICVAYKCENQAMKLSNNKMGIDLGVKELAVCSMNKNKYVFHNINKSKKMKDLESRIKYYDRCISRKYEQNKISPNKYIKTNNIKKLEKKRKALNEKLTNIRSNYIHQITHLLVQMKPEQITMETLNIKSILKNKHMRKYVLEQRFYDFERIMKYKAEYYGIVFVKAERTFPSSKTCSCCGAINRNLKLEDRIFICPECGLLIDRDYNAAINLEKYKT